MLFQWNVLFSSIFYHRTLRNKVLIETRDFKLATRTWAMVQYAKNWMLFQFDIFNVFFFQDFENYTCFSVDIRPIGRNAIFYANFCYQHFVRVEQITNCTFYWEFALQWWWNCNSLFDKIWDTQSIHMPGVGKWKHHGLNQMKTRKISHCLSW